MEPYSVMLLAAGRGMRLRPLTDEIPKPLLSLNGVSLIERHLYTLAGHCKQVLINIAWKGELIREHLGDGSRYGLHIVYSDEGEQALETAGGIRHALPLLAGDTLLVINADVYTDWPIVPPPVVPTGCLAHLLLVDNPEDHPQGDFFFKGGRIKPDRGTRLTFSGMACYRRELFERLADGRCKLSQVLHAAMNAQQLSAEHYKGLWLNVGTAKQLNRARQIHAARSEQKKHIQRS